jgi:Rad3-related DNA helicase
VISPVSLLSSEAHTISNLLTEKLANTERHLDVSKGHSLRTDDKTDELKQLNKSIFRPVITWNKDGKRAAQEAKIQSRFEDERDEREKAMMDIRETQNRLGKATTYGQEGGSGRFGNPEEKKQQRKRFQFEATASDDEMEDELDGNLDEIADVTKRLKALGTTMGQELDTQNKRIERITDKTENLDGRLHRGTERVSFSSDSRKVPFDHAPHSSRRYHRSLAYRRRTWVGEHRWISFIAISLAHLPWNIYSCFHNDLVTDRGFDTITVLIVWVPHGGSAPFSLWPAKLAL